MCLLMKHGETDFFSLLWLSRFRFIMFIVHNLKWSSFLAESLHYELSEIR